MKNSQIQLVKNLNLTTPALNRFAKPSDIAKLVALYGTPLYLIDEDTLHSKARELHNAYSKFNGPVKVAFTIIPGCGRNELFTSVVTKGGVGGKFTENTLIFGSNALSFGLGVAKKW